MAGAGALTGALPSATRPIGREVGTAQPAPPAVEAEPPIRSLSFLIPARNDEGNLPELHRRLGIALATIDLPYEIIFIDDGSNDNTWGVMHALQASDEHVRAIRHRRNFGKAQALANGFM